MDAVEIRHRRGDHELPADLVQQHVEERFQTVETRPGEAILCSRVQGQRHLGDLIGSDLDGDITADDSDTKAA